MSDTTEKHPTKGPGAIQDVETGSSHDGTVEPTPMNQVQTPKFGASLWGILSGVGVEMRGAEPVPVEERTDTQFANLFYIFATSMTSLLP